MLTSHFYSSAFMESVQCVPSLNISRYHRGSASNYDLCSSFSTIFPRCNLIYITQVLSLATFFFLFKNQIPLASWQSLSKTNVLPDGLHQWKRRWIKCVASGGYIFWSDLVNIIAFSSGLT